MTTPTPEQLAKLPKWAQSHIASLESRALMAEAELKDPPAPERDLPPPEWGEPLSKGWNFNAYRKGQSDAVYKACSSSIHHGEGWEKTTSQHPRRLYSTERKATLALRAVIVAEHRKTLAVLDKRLEGLE